MGMLKEQAKINEGYRRYKKKGKSKYGRKTIRRRYLAKAVVAGPSLLLLLYLTGMLQHAVPRGLPQEIEADPNVPLILVADDKVQEEEEDAAAAAAASLASPNLPAVPSLSAPPTQHHNESQHHLRPWEGSLARWFLVHSMEGAGGALVAEATLNRHPHELYFAYLPLHKSKQQRRSGKPRMPADLIHHQWREEGVRWLARFYNCSLGPQAALLHQPNLHISHSITHFLASYCISQKLDTVDCIEVLCGQRSLRGAYTTHLPREHVAHLLQAHPQRLKVVVVVRDPRAMLSDSRQHRGSTTVDLRMNTITQAGVLCSTMAQEVAMVNHLQHKHPQSLQVLHFEHLVAHPSEVLSYLYDFFGLQVTSERLTTIIHALNLDAPEVQRLQTINMWQFDLTLRESRQVDRACYKYYKTLGYRPVPAHINTRNSYFPPWRDPRYQA